MKCGGCTRAVENALRELPGVREVNVDLGAARAVVEGEDLNIIRLVEVVQDAGFEAREA
jgi:copper chaperone